MFSKYFRKGLRKVTAFLPRPLRVSLRGRKRARGQALVITAVAFMAILAFAGLVTDVGTLYLNFTRLKRALDSAAVAAANNIKDSSLPASQQKAYIHEAAKEMLRLNHIEDIASMDTYICDDTGIPSEFSDFCPDPGEDKRKLAWVEATQLSPVYFLSLFGVDNVPITTHSIGEAATLDVVVVIDTSESMGSSTKCPDPITGTTYVGCEEYSANFDPSACNSANLCRPLREAKDAAKSMVDKFFDGYDRIAVVTYDFNAAVHDPDGSTSVVLESDHTAVKNTIDAIQLHDDEDLNDILAYGNPVDGDMNPLDVNGDGTYVGGVPQGYGDAIVSTCTGCGMRVAGDILKGQGRMDSVWVIVLLSDGATNVSDLPDASDANNPVPGGYTNGFCGGSKNSRMWDRPWCTDSDPSTRHCGPFHGSSGECPPNATWVANNSPPYDAEDYARDITDRVALLKSANSSEPTTGEDIAIYTIGLGKAAAPPDYDGEEMLRYMANIGDDNIRNPVPDIGGDDFTADPCDGVPEKTSCGQYYYAPNSAYLTQIFEKIAQSIFTRISQ